MLRRSVRTWLALASFFALAAVPGAHGFGRPAVQRLDDSRVQAQADAVPGELIVRYRSGTTSAEKRAIRREQDATLDETLALPRTEVVELPAGTSVAEAAAAFEADPDVAFAEPNSVRHIADLVPNDPMFASTQMAKISAPSAWDLTTGSSSVIVAVLDSGVAYDHEDLATNIWTNDDPPGGGDDDGNGFVDDTHGWDFVQDDPTPLDFNSHGTHVAGTIGGVGNNNKGVAGVNWTVSIMPIRAGDFYGSLESSDIVNGVIYACANGARVVNESFTGGFSNSAEIAAMSAPACANTLFVAAAGNDTVDTDSFGNAQFPCNYTLANVICVAATTSSDTLAPFSNFGTTSVDLAAPGVSIQSSIPRWSAVGSTEDFEGSAPQFTARWGNPLGSGTPWGRTTARRTGRRTASPTRRREHRTTYRTRTRPSGCSTGPT